MVIASIRNCDLTFWTKRARRNSSPRSEVRGRTTVREVRRNLDWAKRRRDGAPPQRAQLSVVVENFDVHTAVVRRRERAKVAERYAKLRFSLGDRLHAVTERGYARMLVRIHQRDVGRNRCCHRGVPLAPDSLDVGELRPDQKEHRVVALRHRAPLKTSRDSVLKDQPLGRLAPFADPQRVRFPPGDRCLPTRSTTT